MCPYPERCVPNKLDIGECGQEIKDEMHSYWVPRIGEELFRNFEQYIQCVTNADMQIKGEESVEEYYDYITITMVPCETLQENGYPLVSECYNGGETTEYW